MPSRNRVGQPPVVLDDLMDDSFEDTDIDIIDSEEEEEEGRDGDQGMEGEGLEEGGSEEQEVDDGQGSSADDEEEEDEEFSERYCGPSPRARVSEVAAAGGASEIANTPTCPVCMEPWTSQGAHRISCIPCGHVYGRSCLEKWLTQCGNRSAPCPQCDKRFKLKNIINLYAPQVAVPNNELEKEILALKEKNISYLRERDDFQEKMVQAQVDDMRVALKEHLEAHQKFLLARVVQMQANIEENQKAQQEYFMSYVAQHKAAVQAKFKELGMPVVPFPPFQPPSFAIPPWTPQESAPNLTCHTPPRPQGSM